MVWWKPYFLLPFMFLKSQVGKLPVEVGDKVVFSTGYNVPLFVLLQYLCVNPI